MTITSGIEPGDKAPHFKLKNANPSISGEWVSFSESMAENGLIVMFTCNHCPYVVGSESRIEKISLKAQNNALGFVGINSNDPINYTTDSWENMVKRAKSGMSYAYLVDETQEIAKKYGAVCTPDFFGYNKDLELQYRGRMRELKDLKSITTGDSDLFKAMKEIAKTGNGPKNQIPSMGCNIKWINS